MSKVTNLNSSFAYEILLYLNTFYLGMFFVCEVAMGILKAINVSYPENALLTETGIFFGLCAVEVFRIFLGRRGNLASKSKLHIFFTFSYKHQQSKRVKDFYLKSFFKVIWLWGAGHRVIQKNLNLYKYRSFILQYMKNQSKVKINLTFVF